MQARVRAKYLEAAAGRQDILVIRCMQNGLFRSIDDIAAETFQALKQRGIL